MKADYKQGLILILVSCMPILGTLIIAPVLPNMVRHFADVANVEYLVPFVQTAPAFVLALTAMFSGVIVNRFGRKNLLISSMVLYIVAAPAPILLDSLHGIIASRLIVGLAEAGLMTAATTLIGDYFSGAKREKYLGLQVLTTSVSAVIFITVGGILGAHGWKTPFFGYLAPLLLLPFVLLFIWEPKNEQSVARSTNQQKMKMPWSALSGILVITFFAGMCMNLMSVELSFIVDSLGEKRTEVIGIVAALNSAGIVAGALLFGSKRTDSSSVRSLAFSILVAAIGYILLAFVSAVPMVALSGFIAGAAAGFYLPWLLTAANRVLSFEQRSIGVGMFMSCYFLAVVAGPPLATLIAAQLNGLQSAMVVFAIVLVILALATPALLGKSKSEQSGSESGL